MFLLLSSLLYIYIYTSHPPFDPWVSLLWISIDRGFPHFLWQVDGRLLSSESAEWARADSDAGHAASKPAGRNEEAVRNGRGGQEMGIWPTKMVNHWGIYGNIMIFMVHVQSWYPRFHSRDSMVFRYLQWNIMMLDTSGNFRGIEPTRNFREVLVGYLKLYSILDICYRLDGMFVTWWDSWDYDDIDVISCVYTYVHIYTYVYIYIPSAWSITNTWGI
jgi:hypothetical protein